VGRAQVAVHSYATFPSLFSPHSLFYLRGDAPEPSLCADADGSRADAFRALATVGRVHDAGVTEGADETGADTHFESLGLPVVAVAIVVVVKVDNASDDDPCSIGGERVSALVSRLQLLFL
jgi:hypothetical protein